MKGMILAAGYGTRLASGTEPKPLVQAGGRPMIAWALEALEKAGCTHIVVNLHHRAELLQDYFASRTSTVPVSTIVEEEILGTGGGVLNARNLLDGEDFLLYNADIYTGQDLRPMVDAHRASGAMATLMVNTRDTSRALLFDRDHVLLGKERWKNEGTVFPVDALRRGFCGVHVISAEFFSVAHPEGFSDIFDLYRPAIEQGMLRGFDSIAHWTDLGTVERISAFELWLAESTSGRRQGQ